MMTPEDRDAIRYFFAHSDIPLSTEVVQLCDDLDKAYEEIARVQIALGKSSELLASMSAKWARVTAQSADAQATLDWHGIVVDPQVRRQ